MFSSKQLKMCAGSAVVTVSALKVEKFDFCRDNFCTPASSDIVFENGILMLSGEEFIPSKEEQLFRTEAFLHQEAGLEIVPMHSGFMWRPAGSTDLHKRQTYDSNLLALASNLPSMEMEVCCDKTDDNSCIPTPCVPNSTSAPAKFSKVFNPREPFVFRMRPSRVEEEETKCYAFGTDATCVPDMCSVNDMCASSTETCCPAPTKFSAATKKGDEDDDNMDSEDDDSDLGSAQEEDFELETCEGLQCKMNCMLGGSPF
jgi:hypothetical protein